MPNVEIKSSAGLTRKEAGNRLIELGNALVAGSKVEFDWGQDTFKLGVANRVDWELEIEIEGSETELEIEISWRDAASSVDSDSDSDSDSHGDTGAHPTPERSANPRRTRAARAKSS
jgi:amphi-Trp domain-containing protein